MAERVPLYLDFAAGVLRELEAGDILRGDYLQGTRIYSYTAVGGEDSFNVSGITGLNIIGVFRAGIFKRVSSSAVTDSEMIRIHGTDTDAGITATGNVSLVTDDALTENEKLDFVYTS